MPSSSAAGQSAPGARTSCAAAGSSRVVLLEKRTLGQGASSRAAGRRPHAGRDAVGSPARRVVPQVLPGPARRTWHRLRLHSAGLPAAVLYRGRRGCRPRADGHAEFARPVRPLARARPARRAEPDADAGPDAGRHLLRRRRLPHPAAERHRLCGRARHLGRPGPRASRVPRPRHQRPDASPASRPQPVPSVRRWSC